jgi:Putative adhesin
MMGKRATQATASYLVFLVLLCSQWAIAQQRQQTTYAVGPRVLVSISNDYGPITLSPSSGRQVVVTTTSHSSAVSLIHTRHDERIDLRATSTQQGSDLVEYNVLVPKNTFVFLRSHYGGIRASGMSGDLIIKTISGSIEVAEILDAHVDVTSLGGQITVTNMKHAHLDVRTVNGNVKLTSVTETSVNVHSGDGVINYDGDPGNSGDYLLSTSTGNINVSIPAGAFVNIRLAPLKEIPVEIFILKTCAHRTGPRLDTRPRPRAPRPLCLPLSNETGFKSLYLLSCVRLDGVVYGDGKSATPPFSGFPWVLEDLTCGGASVGREWGHAR